MYSGSEASGLIEVTVTVLQGSLSEDVVVRIFTEDATALSSSDYTSVDQLLTFSSTNTTITVSVPIQDDNIDEDDEYLRMRIELDPASGQTNVQLMPDQAQLFIQDDDGKIILMNFSALNFDEKYMRSK